MSETTPKITVVTPSFNQAEFLETTIQSVLGQCWPRLEYIVMDGGSTDGSREIIRRYESSMAHWVSAKDGGQAAALNAAFGRATGDIFCWVNSDDFLLPGALQHVARLLADKPALVYGACLTFHEDSAVAKVLRPRAHDPAALRMFDYIVQPSAFWTRALWEKTGALDTALSYAFDWDWFLRASAHCHFQLSLETLSAYRHHEAHKTGTGGEKRMEEILSVVRRHGSAADVACYEFAMKRRAALAHRSRVAQRARGFGSAIAQRAAQLLTPQLWRMPRGIERGAFEQCRGMLGISPGY